MKKNIEEFKSICNVKGKNNILRGIVDFMLLKDLTYSELKALIDWIEFKDWETILYTYKYLAHMRIAFKDINKQMLII